jgi:hypothetical protein
MRNGKAEKDPDASILAGDHDIDPVTLRQAALKMAEQAVKSCPEKTCKYRRCTRDGLDCPVFLDAHQAIMAIMDPPYPMLTKSERNSMKGLRHTKRYGRDDNDG